MSRVTGIYGGERRLFPLGRFILALSAMSTIIQPHTARALTYADQSEQNNGYNQLILKARSHFDTAMDLESQGKLHDACSYYNTTRDELRDAIFMTINFSGTYDNEQTQRDIDMTMARARSVCGKEDTNGTWPPPESGSSDYSSGSTNNVGDYSQLSQPDWPDMGADVDRLQITIQTAFGYATESSRLYGTRNFAEACSNARAAAESYGKARTDAAAILKAAASYRDIGLRDIRALDAHAAQSGRDAEEFYCKPPRAAINFQAELNAFAAMKNALHLELGTTTPMTSERAVAMQSACITDKLYAANQTRLVFAEALRDGCQSFVLMYNMHMPDRACTSLVQAKSALGRVEADYSTLGKSLWNDLARLQSAFRCSADSGDGQALQDLPLYDAGEVQDKDAAELPPMKLDIKPLPLRAKL